MNIKQSLILMALLIFLPSASFAQNGLKTGYDLYRNILLLDNEKSPDEAMNIAKTLAYLDGIIDGFVLMQDALFNTIIPKEILSEEQREKSAKDMNFRRLNISKDGLYIGLAILIYKNWAEENPKYLNKSAKHCILLALVDAFGWK